MDSDTALGSVLGPDITVVPGGKQVTHTSLFLTVLCTSIDSFTGYKVLYKQY